MNTTQPDYLLSDDQISPNAGARALIQHRAEVERQYRRLDEACAGAALAGIFLSHPWLDACSLRITTSHEYGDHGATYPGRPVSVEEVVPVVGATLPEAVSGEQGWDAGRAAAHLEGQFDTFDSGPLFTLDGHDEPGTTVFRFSREQLGDILGTSPVSGAAAFQALMPGRTD